MKFHMVEDHHAIVTLRDLDIGDLFMFADGDPGIAMASQYSLRYVLPELRKVTFLTGDEVGCVREFETIARVIPLEPVESVELRRKLPM